MGTPEIIVNNAGGGQWKFIDETSSEGARQMSRAFIDGMLERGSGHIVNISSVAWRFVWPSATAYTTARWAVRGFTEAQRSDLRGTGFGVTLYDSTQALDLSSG